MEESLTALVLADAGVTARIDTRVTWSTRPQASALPSITLQVISAVPVDSDEGDSGLVATRVQADCWADSPLDAKKTARALKQLLSGRQYQHSGTEFQGVFTEDERDFDEETTGGTVIYRTAIDFIIWHNQT